MCPFDEGRGSCDAEDLREAPDLERGSCAAGDLRAGLDLRALAEELSRGRAVEGEGSSRYGVSCGVRDKTENWWLLKNVRRIPR